MLTISVARPYFIMKPNYFCQYIIYVVDKAGGCLSEYSFIYEMKIMMVYSTYKSFAVMSFWFMKSNIIFISPYWVQMLTISVAKPLACIAGGSGCASETFCGEVPSQA